MVVKYGSLTQIKYKVCAINFFYNVLIEEVININIINLISNMNQYKETSVDECHYN